MTPSHILSIDPGLSGAFALLEVQSKKVLAIWDMPTDQGQVSPSGVAEIVEMAKFMVGPQGRLVGAVELVSSMPRQAGAFNFGRSAGVVHGVLGALQIPFEMIPASVWKPACGLRKGLNESQADNKTRARELASRLWPEHAAEFAKVKFDGKAEACLIARHAANRMETK
jgi:crossover junction endodeoxyribonuclease RuvC